MHVPLSVEFVEGLLLTSWVVLISYLIIYAWHVWQTVARGQPLNPMKYAFIAASYFLWYFVAFHTNQILLYAIAHRIMHGVQYIVIVYFFMRRYAEQGSSTPGLWTRLVGHGRLRWFLVGGAAYALFFQLLLNRPLDEFGFGVVNFLPYPAIPQFNIPVLDYTGGYELWAVMLLNVYAMNHYFVDSFIWKVRDKQVQEGL